MKKWLIRVVVLYAFNVAVLFVIDLLFDNVHVGFSVLWGAIVLTVATLWVKPAMKSLFTRKVTESGRVKNFLLRKLSEYAISFVVALIVWIIVVVFSGVNSQVFSWTTLLAPLMLLIAWLVYDIVDGSLERVAGRLVGVDMSEQRQASAAQTPIDRRAAKKREIGRKELRDSLTEEQRKLFDELG